MKALYFNLRFRLCYVTVLLFSLTVNAQDIPFNCDDNAYLFQHNDVYKIDLASGNSYEVATDLTPGKINAVGYNPADNFIWGSLSTPAKTIVRIGQNFTTTTYYIEELPTANRYIGDVRADGIYFLKGGGTTYYRIDLNPESDTYGQHESTQTLSQSLSIHDWAFNAVDGQLYTVEKNSNILYRINPDNGQVSAIGEVPVLQGKNYTYGAVYFDGDGRFYVSANQTGTIYVIQDVQNLDSTQSIDSSLFSFGPASSSNDGARCPTAFVPQEICDNGIDDDGDGLIDCEDPSCANFGMCDDSQVETSGGNDGGLESNGRLSEAISQRNFVRAKTNYKFDKAHALRVTEASLNIQNKSTSTIQLQDFIPLTTINEDFAIESTPSDLINITNATEVYSVDYMQNNLSIASVLALKTENGVYEHTKYICDRLLGAELISVSTIEINDETFIKSIIKNVDGSFEYALSLSAKVENNDTNFVIESHWNLNLYEENTTFYNFQIWSDSIDDLYLLAEEVLNLLDNTMPISDYQLSSPPTVFVRKGNYNNGALDLQIINTNGTTNINFDAGYRVTETSDFEYSSLNFNLSGNYITDLQIPTGHLFDIGFRIGDGINTPDDLFMSDGPWGLDVVQPGTVVNNYDVSVNTNPFQADDFPIERNLDLNVTTSTYFAAYRALSPRFQAVDLSSYSSLNLKAKGTGNLEIALVKQSLTNWDEQYKTTIALTNAYQDFTLPFSDFTSSLSEALQADDIVTLVFTMVSEDGTSTTKEMQLEDIHFSTESLSTTRFDAETVMSSPKVYPNPMQSQATLQFEANTVEDVQVALYNQFGKRVRTLSHKTSIGQNSLIIQRDNLSRGLYFCRIEGSQITYKTLKLMVK